MYWRVKFFYKIVKEWIVGEQYYLTGVVPVFVVRDSTSTDQKEEESCFEDSVL